MRRSSSLTGEPYVLAVKLELIRAKQAAGRVVGMVGDGINDAPALAQADVGLVFTHEARTASSEAADVVLLGGEVEQVWQALSIARQTIRVATQRVWLGIGLSVVAMLAASAGYLPPLVGAFLQEGIDVLVIVNALRSARGVLSWSWSCARTGSIGLANKSARGVELLSAQGPQPLA